MNLFLLRHASAGLKRPNPLLDIKRPLDQEGKTLCLQLGQVLNGMKISFDLIVSSPLKRALQTAQMIGTETGHEQEIMISNGIAPTATFAQFQKLLRDCAAYENVLIVGHNPNLTTFLTQMVSGPADVSAGSRIRLRKGSLARVSVQRGPAVLQALLDPKTLRALYTTSTKSSRRKTSRK